LCMGMSSASSVSLISSSAAQEIRAIQIITWLLDIREADYASLNRFCSPIQPNNHSGIFQGNTSSLMLYPSILSLGL
jgi:hypothetical protein